MICDNLQTLTAMWLTAPECQSAVQRIAGQCDSSLTSLELHLTLWISFQVNKLCIKELKRVWESEQIMMIGTY